MTLQDILDFMALHNLTPPPLTDAAEYIRAFQPEKLLTQEVVYRALGISDYEMETSYQEAYDLYHHDEYDSAAAAFAKLLLLDPYCNKYWMGLGASRQLLEEYEAALHAYAIASLLDHTNPYPHFYAYECYVHLSEREESTRALTCAHRLAQQQKDLYPHLLLEIEKHKNKKANVLPSTA